MNIFWGHNAAEARRNICHAMRADVFCERTSYYWFERFQQGDYSLKDFEKSGRPGEINLDELKEVIENDLRIYDVASKLGCFQPLAVCLPTISERFIWF